MNSLDWHTDLEDEERRFEKNKSVWTESSGKWM